MPRRQSCRRIKGYPDNWEFYPGGYGQNEETVNLTLDEYETIRLIDAEDMTQEQCAESMGVSRTTVTAIYCSARKKIADMVVRGRRLTIGGGAYTIDSPFGYDIEAKGNDTMRIAVAYDNGEIFQHFGQTEQFKIYDIGNGKITGEQIIDAYGSGHGALAGLLKSADVDALICGGIGGGAQAALFEAGIRLFGGVSGSADEAVRALIGGTLEHDPYFTCSHHEGHSRGGCGEHGCGGGSCGR